VRRCRSAACGVGFTYPPPDGVGAAPTALPLEGAARGVALRLLAGELRPLRSAVPPPAELLDVGAGGGLRTLAARRLGYRATALEPDAIEAGRARALLGAEGVIEAPLEAAPTPGLADAVLAWHVLEHVEELDAAVGAMRERLRPGGAVVVAVPNPEGAEARALGDRWHGWEPARHRWHLGAGALGAVLRDGGLAEVRVAARGGWRYPASLAFSLAPGLDPQVHPRRAAAGRLAVAVAVPPALAARALGLGPQLVAVAREPGPD